MKKTIFEKLERIRTDIMAQNGAIMSITNDGVSDSTQILLQVHDDMEIHQMFLILFRKEPRLRSIALHAISMCMDVDDYGDFDDDSDDDDDDDPDIVPIGIDGAFCMN